jgi:predicted DNA-binding ribbon-helix-helix protein
MESLVVKRSIVVAGHKTSVSLEDAFWSGLNCRQACYDLIGTGQRGG